MRVLLPGWPAARCLDRMLRQRHCGPNRTAGCWSLNAGMPVGDRLRLFTDFAASFDTRLRNPRWVGVLGQLAARTGCAGPACRSHCVCWPAGQACASAEAQPALWYTAWRLPRDKELR